MRALSLGAMLLVLSAGEAEAHGAAAPFAPGWSLDPWITGPLALAAALFVAGWLRLHRRSTRNGSGMRRQAWLFGAGWAVLAAAVVSPLHEAGERSFTAHMVEHELIMLAAAPLLALSRPLATMLWALPAPGRQALGACGRAKPIRRLWTTAAAPVAATAIQAAALWLWHAPRLFDLALARPAWHVAQHLSFLASALLFWTAMADAARRNGHGVAALCLFATSVVSGALGALMAFSASPWYAGYAAMGIAPFGLNPVEDQQFAGLLMWIPGGLVHAGAALAALGLLLRDDGGVHALRG